MVSTTLDIGTESSTFRKLSKTTTFRLHSFDFFRLLKRSNRYAPVKYFFLKKIIHTL